MIIFSILPTALRFRHMSAAIRDLRIMIMSQASVFSPAGFVAVAPPTGHAVREPLGSERKVLRACALRHLLGANIFARTLCALS